MKVLQKKDVILVVMLLLATVALYTGFTVTNKVQPVFQTNSNIVVMYALFFRKTGRYFDYFFKVYLQH